MKKTVLTLILLSNAIAFGAGINNGLFNSETQKVELNVSYGGGCSEHSFELEFANGCRESFPVQCDLNLVHITDKPDFCEAFITQDLELDLPEGMLGDTYFERAFITVLGSGETAASFQLPK